MQVASIRKKALVTGGGGFIGSKLVKALLEKGVKVKVLDLQLGHLRRSVNRNLEFIGTGGDQLQGGMADASLVKEVVKDVEVIYHLAINWDARSWKHRLPLADLFDVNVRGTLNLLEAARAHKVRHFLFASSSAVYGENESPNIDEETVCRPELFRGDPGPSYAILKLATERLCLMYHRQHQLPLTALRIGYVFDAEEAPAEGEVHIDDVVRAFLLATLNKKAYGEVFNVSYNHPLSTDKVRRILGWEPEHTREVISKR